MKRNSVFYKQYSKIGINVTYFFAIMYITNYKKETTPF